jgi:hypothetical protein
MVDEGAIVVPGLKGGAIRTRDGNMLLLLLNLMQKEYWSIVVVLVPVVLK